MLSPAARVSSRLATGPTILPSVACGRIRQEGTARRLRAMALPFLLLPALGCGDGMPGDETGSAPDTLTAEGRLRATVGILAHDSMEGRAAGSREAAMAADFIALELERRGLEPAFGRSFLQTVPLLRIRDGQGRTRLILPGEDGKATLPEGWELVEELFDANVAAVSPGTDPLLAAEVVVVGAHFDHVGVGEPAPGSPAALEGDSIFNGADDDASGVAAVLEVARSFSRDGPSPRTVLFLFSAAEEAGLLGTRWYLRDPAVPLGSTVADLQVEMIGRPDPLAGGAGKAWLSGYERSTMGPLLVAEGIPIVADPRPEQRFFFRSDNAPFASEGIPAHTISSFNLHEDYHTPDDEVERLDFSHMAGVVEAVEEAVRVLASGPRPVWEEGGRPATAGEG